MPLHGMNLVWRLQTPCSRTSDHLLLRARYIHDNGDACCLMALNRGVAHDTGPPSQRLAVSFPVQAHAPARLALALARQHHSIADDRSMLMLCRDPRSWPFQPPPRSSACQPLAVAAQQTLPTRSVQASRRCLRWAPYSTFCDHGTA